MSDTPRVDVIALRHAGEALELNEATVQYNDLLEVACTLERERDQIEAEAYRRAAEVCANEELTREQRSDNPLPGDDKMVQAHKMVTAGNLKRAILALTPSPAAQAVEEMRKNDARWREASLRGFPRFNNTLPESSTPWYVYWDGKSFYGATPDAAIDDALVAKEQKT